MSTAIPEDPKATLCFCFGYSVADVRAATDAEGNNAVVADITDKCRRGLGRCAQTSPSGRCCLARVRAAAKVRAPAGEAEPAPCCEGK
jgi:hypothetical protein